MSDVRQASGGGVRGGVRFMIFMRATYWLIGLSKKPVTTELETEPQSHSHILVDEGFGACDHEITATVE